MYQQKLVLAMVRFLTERITSHPVVVVVVSIYPPDDVCIFFLPVTRGLEPGASTEFRENTVQAGV